MKRSLILLRYFVAVHITALIILSCFRIFLYLTSLNQIASNENISSLLTHSLAIGVKFDNLISCYIIAFPLVITSIWGLLNKIPTKLITGINVFFIVFYSLIFILSAADIPYFNYFFTHIGIGAFEWFKFGKATTTLIFNQAYILYIISWIIACVLFGVLVFIFSKKMQKDETLDSKIELKKSIPIILLAWGICFIGIRGSLQRYPLSTSFAYFSENSLFNQLGINPAFFLYKSFEQSQNNQNNVNNLMSVEEALSFTKNELKIENQDKNHPINRDVKYVEQPLKANVIIVLMESLSSVYLDWELNGKKTLPFINDLISKSYYFKNFYSSGVHTNNGIVSSLYGFPPEFNESMMNVDVAKYTGLPYWLRKKGYETLFFITGNPQYDNMNSFLRENEFNKIFSIYDYPSEKAVNNFGVQDDYMLEFGINKLNEVAASKKSFLATFLTVSNHPPYIIPKRFKNSNYDDETNILSFVDYSIENFMNLAAKQEWYKNTIFIFEGDHGAAVGEQKFSMPLSYNHIPLIIFSPLFKDAPKVFDQFGGQIDIFPTTMGILKESYTNNSLGVDLMKENRSCMFFENDNQLGCINNDYFYIRNLSTSTDELYSLYDKTAVNLVGQKENILEPMKKYGVSMSITSNYLIKNKLTH